MNEAKTVTVGGKDYRVLWTKTADDLDREGLRHVAACLRSSKVKAQLGLQRPKGRRAFFAYEFEDGRVRIVCQL